MFVLDEFVPYRLSVTTNLVSEVIARAYETRHGLKVAEWRVLATLAKQGRTNQQAICTATRMDKMTVSRATSVLTERGLVARTATPYDGRAYLVSLTRAGASLHERIVPDVLALEARLFAALGAAERRLLVALLERVEAAALLALGPDGVVRR